MRIAFYAPLKPLDHPVPSGDRLVARLLVTALEQAGFAVDVASKLRSRVGDGNSLRQAQLAELGGALARRLIRRYENGFLPRPDAWFTYHLYYKAPDWIGPLVARELGIPYFICEASHAPKRATGPWAASHRAVEHAVEQAAAVFCPNRADMECVLPVSGAQKLHFLPPFADIATWADSADNRVKRRANTSSDVIRLVTVAMMRPGDKMQSYKILAAALADLPVTQQGRWHLTLVGDGPARADVAALFAQFPKHQVHFAGQCDPVATRQHLAHSDLCVWPAINEAYGMALLEAQAAGVPVLAGNSGGVGGIVDDGQTGWLVAAGDVTAFCQALSYCLDAPETLVAAGSAAVKNARQFHDVSSAAAKLYQVMLPFLTRPLDSPIDDDLTGDGHEI